MTDVSIGEPFATKTYDLVNATGCIPVTDVIAAMKKCVLMSDAIELCVICFFLGMAWIFFLFWLRDKVE